MGKRAWQYPEATGITNEDVILLDSPTGGSRSIKANKIGSVLINKTITERGTFDAADDNADGYKKVTVDVPYTDVEVASGPIASWDDGEDLPLKSLTCFITPVQDLHGYDAPWAGGAGKNLLPMTVESIKSKNTTGTWNNNVYTKNDMSFEILTDGANNVTGIKVNGTRNVSSPVYFTIGTFDFAANETYKVNGGVDLPSPIPVYFAVNGGVTVISSADYTQTFTSDTTKDVIIVVERTQQISNVIFHPMIRLSTESDSTYAPYSNICPISGWDECNVSVCGVNIWDEEWEVGGISVSTGQNESANDIIRCKNHIHVKPNTTYHIVDSSKVYCLFLYDKNKNYITTVNVADIQGANYTTRNDCHYIRFRCFASYGTTYNNDISINYPSTDTSYHAYNGQTYTIDLDGTRYGGKVDLISGVLTVDRAYVDLGTLNYSYYSGNLFTASISNLKPVSNERLCNALCSIYVAKQGNEYASIDGSFVAGFNSASTLVIHDSRFSDATAFKTAMNGAQLVYELATPITIQLTPTQVKSLVGENNIYSDTGDVDVEYQKIWVRPSA